MVLPASFMANLIGLKDQKVLVTGGAGFLGRHIVELLVECQCREIIVFDVVVPNPPFQSPRVRAVAGNLLDLNDLQQYFAGLYCVFHVASPSPTANNPKLFNDVNVNGTNNVISACRSSHTPRLVYTSSASVMFDGRGDQCNWDEKSPIPSYGLDAYTRSKIKGESLVLKASDTSLFTCSIRPHGIFGPRDPHLFPGVARTAQQRKNKYMIGNNTNLVDFTYVENVSYAHALAAVQLAPNATINGKTYFISNKQPVLFWDFMTWIYHGLDYNGPHITLPFAIMKPVAALLVQVRKYWLSLPIPPSFTLQAVNYAGLAHYYSSEAATKDFGYFPPIELMDALQRTHETFQHLRRKPSEGNERTKEDFDSVAASSVVKYGAAALILAVLAVVFGPSLTKWIAGLSMYYLLILLLHLALLVRYLWRGTSLGSPSVQFTEKPNLREKTVLITGANKGIGYETAMQFAKLGATVILACRDISRATVSVKKIQSLTNNPNISAVKLDLASFASVRAMIDTLTKDAIVIDYFVHNAGAMIEKSVTADGHDTQLQCNYLSSFFINQLLLQSDLLSASAKIVLVTSTMHHAGHINFSDLESTKSYNRLSKYNETKLMQVCHAFKLQRVLDQTLYGKINNGEIQSLGAARRTAVSVNPGAIVSDFHYHFLPKPLMDLVHPLLNLFVTRPLAAGAWPVLYACVSKEMVGVGGVYVDNCKVAVASAEARSIAVQDRLWDASMRLIQSERGKSK